MEEILNGKLHFLYIVRGAVDLEVTPCLHERKVLMYLELLEIFSCDFSSLKQIFKNCFVTFKFEICRCYA